MIVYLPDVGLDASHVLAVCILRNCGEFRDAQLSFVSSQQSAIDRNHSILIGLGGTYDGDYNIYDHDGRSGSAAVNWKIVNRGSSLRTTVPLSCAGMIYNKFGGTVLKERRGVADVAPSEVFGLVDQVYCSFVHEFDAHAHRVNKSDGKSQYLISTDIPSAVSELLLDPDCVRTTFERCISIVEPLFLRAVDYVLNIWRPAKELVGKAFRERRSYHKKGGIMVLNKRCNFLGHLYECERLQHRTLRKYNSGWYPEEHKELVYYVVSPASATSETVEGDSWMVQGIRTDGFRVRVEFPSAWLGLRDDELIAQTRIEGCKFVHSSGHLAIHKNMAGAVKMAQLSLELNNK